MKWPHGGTLDTEGLERVSVLEPPVSTEAFESVMEASVWSGRATPAASAALSKPTAPGSCPSPTEALRVCALARGPNRAKEVTEEPGTEDTPD